MREDYWVVTDEEVVGKTGWNLAYWTEVLTAFGAEGRKSGEVVDHLQVTSMCPVIGREP